MIEREIRGDRVEIRVGLDDGFEAFTRSEHLFGLDVEFPAFEDGGPRFWADDFRVRLVQVATTDVAYVLRPDVEAEREAIVSFLGDESKHFVSHSNTDPLAVAVAFGVILGQRAVDTLLLAYLLEPGETVDHDLKSMTAELIDDGLVDAQKALYATFDSIIPKGSGIRRGSKAAIAHGFSNVPLDDETFLVYAGLDALYVRRLWPILVDLCDAFPHLVKVENWLATQTTGITLRGLRLDVDATREALTEVAREVDDARKRVEDRCGFAALSPKRVEWLAERGVEFSRMTEKGNPSLDKEALPGLIARYGDVDEVGDMLRDTLTISSLSNLKTNLSNFLKAADADGRVHPNIHTLRAHTARMSITAPAMQTLSKADARMRGAFVADEGYALASADFANVELRVAAGLSGEQKMIDAFLRGDDLHNVTTDLIYGSGSHTDKGKRAIGKKANFLTVYGGGAKALHVQGGVPFEQAQEVIRKFRDAYPTLTRYGWDLAEVEGHIVTDTGRMIPVDDDRKYASANYMIQSTARDLLVEAVYKFCTVYGHADALFLLVHDEIVIHAPVDEIEQVAADLKASMTTEFRGVPIVADVTILGDRWNG